MALQARLDQKHITSERALPAERPQPHTPRPDKAGWTKNTSLVKDPYPQKDHSPQPHTPRPYKAGWTKNTSTSEPLPAER
jgi:hypothetical protein